MDEIAASLAGHFDKADLDVWRDLATTSLKGRSLEDLVRRTADGLSIEPLYHGSNAPAASPPGPGVFPFTRGRTSFGHILPDERGLSGWDVRTLVRHPDPRTANAQILEDLKSGATSIELLLGDECGSVAQAGVHVPDLAALETVLDGVMLDVAPVGLGAGTRSLEAAALLIALLEKRSYPPAAVRADLGLDPIAAGFKGARGEPSVAMAAAAQLALHARGSWPGLTVFRIDGAFLHDAGATPCEELAFVAASAVAILRALEAVGIEPEEAARQIVLGVAVDADIFTSVAKLRALRTLWSAILAGCNAARAAPATRLHATTASIMMTQRDRHVNLLRCSIAGFAAAIAGADILTVLPFDHAFPFSDATARRLARNTQIILQEEVALCAVVDPAGGSHYLEHLTGSILEAAWDRFTEIEAAGGMIAAVEAGSVQAAIEASFEKRRAAVATREAGITGVSDYPDLAEKGLCANEGPTPAIERGEDDAGNRGATCATLEDLLDAARAGEVLPSLDLGTGAVKPVVARRLSEPYEALRDRTDALSELGGRRPRILVLGLGERADHAAAAEFACEILAVGGIEGVVSAPAATAEAALALWRHDRTAVAVIAAAAGAMDAQAGPLAASLRAAGTRCILVTGRPRTSLAGADLHLFKGMDVPAALATIVGHLEAAEPEYGAGARA